MGASDFFSKMVLTEFLPILQHFVSCWGLGAAAQKQFISIHFHSILAAPNLVCTSSFGVTISAGNWASIAVEGYEHEQGDAEYRKCVSQTENGKLEFNVQTDCKAGEGTMTVKRIETACP